MVRAAALKGRTLRNPHAYGVLDTQAPGQRSFRLDVSLDFPEVCLAHARLPQLVMSSHPTMHCSHKPVELSCVLACCQGALIPMATALGRLGQHLPGLVA